MPHHADDERYPHLSLVREEANPDRRRHPAPPARPPNRGGRQRFARDLRTRVESIEEEAARKAPPAGIHPHLVFRVPLAPAASPQVVTELLDNLRIGVVSIEHDNAIIAFRDAVGPAGVHRGPADATVEP